MMGKQQTAQFKNLLKQRLNIEPFLFLLYVPGTIIWINYVLIGL